MLTITIDCTYKSDLVYHLQEVARAIEEGYTNGLVGCTGDSWCIDGEGEPEEDDEE